MLSINFFKPIIYAFICSDPDLVVVIQEAPRKDRVQHFRFERTGLDPRTVVLAVLHATVPLHRSAAGVFSVGRNVHPAGLHDHHLQAVQVVHRAGTSAGLCRGHPG